MSFIIELNLKTNLDFLSSKRKNWYKIDNTFVEDRSNDIDWEYSDVNLSVECMWEEIYNKMHSITEQVPDNVIKTNGRGEILVKLPWDNSKLVRKRKEKDQSWNAFDIAPNMENFQTSLHKQDGYQKCEFEAKIKYENKIIKKIKSNSKPVFKYLRSKSKLKKTVGNLKNPSGKLSDSPQETADILADFFHSVFKAEPYGPLTEDAYMSNKVITGAMDDLVISQCDVKKLLLDIDINKSMGPDEIHPKLLKFLAADENFLKALTKLFNECVKQEVIPNIWKTALVIPLHKKGSVNLPDNYRPVSLTCIMCMQVI